MNVKHLAKFAGSAVGAGAAAKNFNKARHDHDRLKMIDALLSVLSIAITVAIIVREIRANNDNKSRVVELKDT